jgi:hypothetical protein
MMITWAFASFAFFMIPYYIKNIKGVSIYYLSLATELAELFASIACAIIQRYMTLKKAMFSSCIFIAIGSFTLIFATKNMDDDHESSTKMQIFQSGLILLTNFGIVAAFDKPQNPSK